MVHEPVAGNKYWTVKNTFQKDQGEPCKPWLGILGNEHPGNDAYLFRLFHFDHETGKPDFDYTNTAVVTGNDLFFLESEAEERYRKNCFLFAEELLEKASHYYSLASGFPKG